MNFLCPVLKPSLCARPARTNPPAGSDAARIAENGTALWKKCAYPRVRSNGNAGSRSGSNPFPSPKWKPPPEYGWYTAIPELDRVLGGGIVPGSVVLVGGDPGIGKSTLMMQMAASLKERTFSTSRVRNRSRRCVCALTGSCPRLIIGAAAGRNQRRSRRQMLDRAPGI